MYEGSSPSPPLCGLLLLSPNAECVTKLAGEREESDVAVVVAPELGVVCSRCDDNMLLLADKVDVEPNE